MNTTEPSDADVVLIVIAIRLAALVLAASLLMSIHRHDPARNRPAASNPTSAEMSWQPAARQRGEGRLSTPVLHD